MSSGTGIYGKSLNMMLMGSVNHRITGLRLGEVGCPSFDDIHETKIGQGAHGSTMNLQMSIICICSHHSSQTLTGRIPKSEMLFMISCVSG
jgi:hypothetical protein